MTTTPGITVATTLEILLEAARRANWDAQHGPAHLRTGRFVVSAPVEMKADGSRGKSGGSAGVTGGHDDSI